MDRSRACHDSAARRWRVTACEQMAQRVMPVLLLTDLDRSGCPAELITAWLPGAASPRLFFRVAVRETESWLLADRPAFADFLGITIGTVPDRPDELTDPKAALLDLVRKSKRRELRQEILPRPGVSFPVGLGYNDQWCRFVRDHWETGRAAKASPSLARAVDRLARFSE